MGLFLIYELNKKKRKIAKKCYMEGNKMGKISPVSSKYIIHASINISGIVDKPDVIGAIFGQTEGLLGADLELRELQRSGRIGRIEVTVDTKSGKSMGDIIIPSSLDKAETAIVGAALEVIQRIGPCTAKIRVSLIEDVRVSKRELVVSRAKELLKQLIDTSIPDSQELADEVAYSVRVMEIQEYGKERLSAGPNIEESDDILVVEGRADVLNLLKHGIKNAIAINGTNVPETVVELCKRKIVTVFVDGDRGGDLIIQEMMGVTDVDYVTRAPDGKEVEEITKKEIHKAIRSKVSPEQFKHEIADRKAMKSKPRPIRRPPVDNRQKTPYNNRRPVQQESKQVIKVTAEEKKQFSKMLEDLIGTRGAYVLDNKLSILGKVPLTELGPTLKSLGTGVHAIVFDGVVENDIVGIAEKTSVKYLVGMSSKARSSQKLKIITSDNL
jgi:DNA primase